MTSPRRTLGRALCLAVALGGGAQAGSKLTFDASEPRVAPASSAPERRALQTLYVKRGLRVCPDFSVLARANGRYTADRAQTLYLVQNCYDGVASDFYRKRYRGDLLILNGTQLTYFTVGVADDVSVLPALDGGRLNFLLLQVWAGPSQGYFWASASLQRYAQGAFSERLNLGTVYLDQDTPAGPPISRRRALFFDPAQPNIVRVREYTSPQCVTCAGDSYQAKVARLTMEILIDLTRPPAPLPWHGP